MKQYIISIPDNKASFFLELMKNISFVKSIKENFSDEISEEQISVVRERIDKYENNPESYKDLDDLDKKMNLDE